MRAHRSSHRRLSRVLLVVLAALLAAAVTGSNGYGYTKPVTYNEGNVVFKDRYLQSPHSWIIVKAVDLIRHDGYTQEADVAQKYLLPMMEGVTYNDVWGDADLAGGSILDYYIPGSPDTNFGYGCAVILGIFAYKNCTEDFQSNGFYGYGNAADEAQYRYDYAKRIVLGNWGADSRDRSAGWVTDTLLGQDDPMDDNWGTGTTQIDSGGYSGTSFGSGQTPASSMLYLLQHGTNAQVVFADQSDPALSTIDVPTFDVVDNHGPGWLDDTFGGADDVEAYNGYDGHGFAVYANWTPDTGSGCSDTCNAAPMVVRLPVGSTAHAFFNLGWAIHLLEDQTTPVHTTNDSFTTREVHNDIEKRADEVLTPPYVSYNGQLVKDALPALTCRTSRASTRSRPRTVRTRLTTQHRISSPAGTRTRCRGRAKVSLMPTFDRPPRPPPPTCRTSSASTRRTTAPGATWATSRVTGSTSASSRQQGSFVSSSRTSTTRRLPSRSSSLLRRRTRTARRSRSTTRPPMT